jgi:hypothetical protein
MSNAGRVPLRAQKPVSVEEIATRYLDRADGNPSLALRILIEDALADLTELERRSRRTERMLSRGYVRASPS